MVTVRAFSGELPEPGRPRSDEDASSVGELSLVDAASGTDDTVDARHDLADVVDLRTPVRRLVVCDDDDMIRLVIGRVATGLGYEVVAEACSPVEAMDAVSRTDAGLVILDLALRGGHGEEVLGMLSDTSTRAVVFSAYVRSPQLLLDAGAVAVIEKPDVAELEAVLERLLTERPPSPDDEPNRRRPAPRPASPLPARSVTSPSGFERWDGIERAVPHLVPGDAILVLDVVPGPSEAHDWDEVLRIDHRVALGRLAASTLRDDDRASLAPSGVPVVLVVGGHPEAPGAVFDRVEDRWRTEIGAGLVVGAFCHVRPTQDPTDQLVDLTAIAARGEIDPLRPLRML